VIEGGLGADVLTGNAGNDLFLYRLDGAGDLGTLNGDTIIGFEGKDLIDLYNLFSDFDIESDEPVAEAYFCLQLSGGNTEMQFDKDGGGDGFVTLATLQGVISATLEDVVYPHAELPPS
jgi:hypothetical protein